MTIFRSSALGAVLIFTGCSENMPQKGTALGEILRMPDLESTRIALKDFVQARLDDRTALRRKFESAGFVRTTVLDERGRNCEWFQWQGKPRGSVLSNLVRVTICEGDVFVGAWQNAP